MFKTFSISPLIILKTRSSSLIPPSPIQSSKPPKSIRSPFPLPSSPHSYRQGSQSTIHSIHLFIRPFIRSPFHPTPFHSSIHPSIHPSNDHIRRRFDSSSLLIAGLVCPGSPGSSVRSKPSVRIAQDNRDRLATQAKC